MLSQSFLKRRQFFTVAASASFLGVVGFSSSNLWSAETVVKGETDHFYYRLAPAGTYVDSHRGDKAFGFSEGKIFLSDDNCTSWAHSASFPDAENITFSCLLKNGNVDGSEMLVWGNYCNVDGGPVPANIYYSTDNGRTIKIAFGFGRNPDFQMAGSERSSLLGNPANPLICRHIHAVSYNPAEKAFYACTGDLERGHGVECHWLRRVYDPKGDRWE